MIRISYSSIPQGYLDFIDKFRDKLKKWIKKGEIGNGNTKVELCPECELVFRFLIQGNRLDRFLLIPADELPSFIQWVETRFPDLAVDRKNSKVPRSSLFLCLSKAFYSLGYKDPDFPDFELTKASGINACPYCNAEDIVVQAIDEDGLFIRNSELDHFFPRDLFPYLSINLYNLVPSGQICNGGALKYNKDSYALKLVNPFSLLDSNGFLFELDICGKGVLTRGTFKTSCIIVTNVVFPSLSANESVFCIRSRYKQELGQAQIVWEKHREISSKGYRKAVEEKSKAVGEELSFEDWIQSELQINPYNYNKKKLSKLSMDIWWQLERIRV